MSQIANRLVSLLSLWVASAVCLFAAAIITPIGYDTINGTSGTFSYMDTAYTPCLENSCLTTGAFLSGGSGEIQDGTTPVLDWTGYTGGAWVGWYLNSPSLTFHFQGSPTIDQLSLYLDNTPSSGDVRLPSSAIIAGDKYAVSEDPNWGPRWVDFNISAFTGNTLTITLNQSLSGITGETWIMLGEAKFMGASSAIPEPAQWGPLAAGLILMLGYARRRRRQ